MATSITTLSSQFEDVIIQDTNTDENIKNDITQGTGSVYSIQVANGIGSTSIFFKIYDGNSAVVGTTEPIFIMKVAASATKQLIIPDGMPFTTGLCYCTTDQNGSQGAGSGYSSASGNVTVRIVTS